MSYGPTVIDYWRRSNDGIGIPLRERKRPFRLHALRDEFGQSHFGNPAVALEAFKHFFSLSFEESFETERKAILPSTVTSQHPLTGHYGLAGRLLTAHKRRGENRRGAKSRSYPSIRYQGRIGTDIKAREQTERHTHTPYTRTHAPAGVPSGR